MSDRPTSADIYPRPCRFSGIHARQADHAFGPRRAGNPAHTSGVHCIADLYECCAERLNDTGFLRRIVAEAARRSMSQVLEIHARAFDPQGVTVFALLAESHISIHTWPEHRYAAVDLFTCHAASRPQRACRYISESLEAATYDIQLIQRGARLQAEAPIRFDCRSNENDKR